MEPTLEISHRGEVSAAAIEMAVDKIKSLADHCREPIGHIEIRLTMETDLGRERPAVAEATLIAQGNPIRAHIAAESVTEAIDLLVDRLRRRVRRYGDRLHQLPDRRRTGDSGPGSWRHGDIKSMGPEYFDIPFDEREVRRHKTFELYPISVETAAFDLHQLGHDFYLFVDETSGLDCLVRRGEAGEVILESVDPEGYADVHETHDLTTDTRIPPALTLAEAKELLETNGDQMVFYRSGKHLRGHVLYRRFDGHYGVLTAT